MSKCSHYAHIASHTGALSSCIFCGLELIYDGTKWTWRYGLDERKVQKLITAFQVDAMTGKHESTLP